MTGRTLVLGSTGFMGRTLQELALRGGTPDDFVFGYRSNRKQVRDGLQAIRIDLLDRASARQAGDFQTAIWVAGNSDHNLGWADPRADFELSAGTMLGLLENFTGRLTMLSSQAVYFGLEGPVSEESDHIPAMPYGFGKLASEQYARWALQAGRLEGLWILRLMYAFGRYEKPRRLLARCIRASLDGSAVTVAGQGRSFLNPLPAEFVADVLAHCARQLLTETPGFLEVTNINHPQAWTVIDVVDFLGTLGRFEYSVVDDGEQWPVRFHGRVDRLMPWLDHWLLSFPDVEQSLAAYRDERVRRTTP